MFKYNYQKAVSYEELQKITEEYKAISTELEQKYERWEKLAEFV